MLERLLEQLNIKNEELRQAENGREKLREENEESYERLKEYVEQFVSESAATEIRVREFDTQIEQIKDDIKRINEDLDLYAGS